MNTKHISVIYFYAISAASLALIVVGIFSSVNFVVNITQYDKYPLRYRSSNECDIYPNSYSKPIAVPVSGLAPTPTQKELDESKKKCEQVLDSERKQQKLDDLKSSITFSIVGWVLFLIHFPLALKKSKEAK